MDTFNYFNYFTEIEEYFWRKRGAHLLVSPLDWAILETWQADARRDPSLDPYAHEDIACR